MDNVRNPAEWNITIDKNTSRQCTKIDYSFIKVYRVESALLSVGKIKGEILSKSAFMTMTEQSVMF